jgi:hypothetical protein
MKRFFVLLGMLSWICQTEAQRFFFLGIEDKYYENPANWYPAYPGIASSAGDTLVIMDDMAFGAFPLELGGFLQICMGVRVHSAGGGIKVKASGQIENQGELLVRYISSSGKVVNSLGASLQVFDYHALAGATTFNAASAVFCTLASLVNEGRFDNHSRCVAGSDFSNRSAFYGVCHSLLDVRGNIILAPGCIMYLPCPTAAMPSPPQSGEAE